MKRYLWASLTLALGTFGAYASDTSATTTQTQYPLTITNCGRDITFQSPPTRVVVQPQNLFETLLSLGLTEAVIGWSPFRTASPTPGNEEAYASVPAIGSGPLALEVVVGQESDLFLTNRIYDKTPVADLERLGVRTMVTTTIACNDQTADASGRRHLLDSVFADVETIGQIFDRNAEAAALIAEHRAALDRVEAAVADKPDVTAVSLVFGNSVDGGLWAYSRDSMANEIIERAGGKNLLADKPGLGGEISPEVLSGMDPDVIVIALDGSAMYDEITAYLAAHPQLGSLRAIAQGRMTYLLGEEFMPSLRFTDGVERVAAALHPAD